MSNGTEKESKRIQQYISKEEPTESVVAALAGKSGGEGRDRLW